MNEITPAEIAEVLNLEPLRGLPVAAALIAAHAEKIDREANYRYWAQKDFGGRGFRIAAARLENIEYVLRVLEAAQRAESVAVAEVPAPVEIAPQSKARAPRCPFYREIRRAYAIATERGLDTRADEAMRAAFARYLGRAVPSRDSLGGADWARVANAMKTGALGW